ncbi:winged helix-turn-helix transcriptional regulator [Rhodocytophaga rosea]|uniref:Winged helix-turn-helix transcriptional regulator n=1 Tax=Rhodocytophaga rosea TaxID=2704465 RepID=A0A6C0GEJ1_9BACT|nr:MarR family winged helix-turn-helix transcriptional regulator [Rhodocytophaga rosea]QHT66386.1 winged helix-turn-helix transcriptional regulator [Rhodocytophaga rosea]
MEETNSVVQHIRAFNRFYTDLIGLLNKNLLNSNYSLVEVRILYEIHIRESCQASQIMTAIHIDKSYLSRLLKKMEKADLIKKSPSAQDARAHLLTLTQKGREVFLKLNQASDKQIEGLISALSPKKQQAIVGHMQSIMNLLTINSAEHDSNSHQTE